MPVLHCKRLSAQCQRRNSIVLRVHFGEPGHCPVVNCWYQYLIARSLPIDEGIVKAKLKNEIAQFILDLDPRFIVGIRIRSKYAQ